MKICIASMGPLDVINQMPLPEFVDGRVAINPGLIANFASARNLLLEEAAAAGYDWAIVLDTDESIETNLSRAELRQYLGVTKHDVLMVPHIDGTYSKERVFRLPARGHYTGPTHEAFILDDGASRGMLGRTWFDETPKTPEQYRAKALRDIGILEDYTRANPDDPRWWYYLGDSRSGIGDREGAVHAFTWCFSCNGWDEEGAWAAFRIAQIHADVQNWDGAIAWCAKGMTRRADFPELPWLAGWCCYQAGRYQQAIAWSRLALAYSADPHALIYPELERVIFRHPPAHYEAPYDVIRWSLRQLGEDPDQAEGFFKVSLAKRQKSER